MKNAVLNYGGLVIFYLVIIIGVLLLNMRFSYINEIQSLNNDFTMNN